MTADVIPFRHPQARYAFSALESELFVIDGALADGHEHNATADQVDATGDVLSERLDWLIARVRHCKTVQEAHQLAALQAELHAEVRRLDSIEDWHRHENDGQCIQGRVHARRGISIAESQLVTRRRNLRPCEVEAELIGVDGWDGGAA